MEDATANMMFNRKEALEIQSEMDRKLRIDKIKWLEARGYRVILNNTKDNTNRDNDMIAVLEANGYKIIKE
jgi:hypothetical protein